MGEETLSKEVRAPVDGRANSPDCLVTGNEAHNLGRCRPSVANDGGLHTDHHEAVRYRSTRARAVNGPVAVALLAHLLSLSQDRGDDAPGGIHAGRL